MRQYFPSFGITNVTNYYLMVLFSSHWFVLGNWTYFFLKLMTYGELGLSDGVAFAIGLLAEIPSGAVADLIGRKRTVVLAKLLIFLSMFITGIAFDKWQLFFATVLFAVGGALYSGAAEALLYDSLKEHDQEKHFDLVSSRVHIIGIMLTAITAIAGGFIYSVSPRGPFLAAAVMAFLALIFALKLKEPLEDKGGFGLNQYLDQLIVGSKQLNSHKLKPFLPMLFAVVATFYMYDVGYIRLMLGSYFGFSAEAQSILLGAVTIVVAAVLIRFTLIRNLLKDYNGMLLLCLIFALSFFVASSTTAGAVGILVLLAISIGGGLATPWSSVIINSQLESKYRATALSAFAFLTKLPYPLIAIGGGLIIESGQLATFCLAVGVILGAVALYQIVFHKSY